ncbi:MAG TPA: hypothetical protein VFU21_11575 [Kofleriaceae bacterium]|nr:hypothetical protein [Kofleriaceae bacterium]
MRSTSAVTKCGQVAALIAAGLALAPSAAAACKLNVRAPHGASIAPLEAPVILDAGFEPPANDGGHGMPGRLWIRLAEPGGADIRYILEPVAGHAPRGLPWGTAMAAEGEHLVIPLDAASDPGGPEPFVFGFRLRAAAPGHLGPPSDPTWISFSTADRAAERAVPRSDQVLFVLLVLGLALVWYWYRREESAESKIRLAALVALISVIFLSVTSAMPWLSLAAEPAAGPVSCLLGQEGSCLFRAGAAYAAFDDVTMPAVAYEIQRWQCASAALRMGQVTALALLLPALVWLLVDPRHRAAQAATAVGASVGGFVFLVALLYRHSTPSWLDADLYWTADIALVTASHIVVAAVLVVRQSFALLAPAAPLPKATARYR